MSSNTSTLLGKIAGYTEILAKDPKSTVFVSLAEAYRQLGMLDDALEIIDKGLANLPQFVPGYVARGRVLAQKNQLADAAVALEKALAIEPENLSAIKGLARVRYRQGYLDKARTLLEKGLTIKPGDEILGKMLASLGPDGGAAQDSAPAAAPPRQQPPAADEEDGQPGILTATLAELYVKQGLLHDAARVYREILRHEPDNQKARQRLVELKRQIEAQEQQEEQQDTPVSTTGPVQAAENPAPASAVSSVASQERSEDKLAAIYQRWLAAIAQRRAHVR
ncbi:MAG: tetratricopeptide repeat protein [Deltaproteobacteria bacterium]|nr:MAG: tetratricopeptide repeat protein [Deltaproteobacteria bacterium]